MEVARVRTLHGDYGQERQTSHKKKKKTMQVNHNGMASTGYSKTKQNKNLSI